MSIEYKYEDDQDVFLVKGHKYMKGSIVRPHPFPEWETVSSNPLYIVSTVWENSDTNPLYTVFAQDEDGCGERVCASENEIFASEEEAKKEITRRTKNLEKHNLIPKFKIGEKCYYCYFNDEKNEDKPYINLKQVIVDNFSECVGKSLIYDLIDIDSRKEFCSTENTMFKTKEDAKKYLNDKIDYLFGFLN